MSEWDLGAVLALGAFHGINPAMGWLFAAAIGFQARSRRALVAALGPIAVGHAASMGATVLLIDELRVFATETALRFAGAAVLVSFALYRIVRSHRHPRWVGMRLRPWELAFWSFLMSTAHGAGLMLFPVIVGMPAGGGSMVMPTSIAVVLVHTLAMVAVAGVTALVVYQSVGVGILRTGWLNMDRAWSYVLGAGAAATLLVA